MPRPRVISRTDSTLISNGDMARVFNEIADMLEISGELWSQPYPLEFLIKTDMDLESGEIRLVEGR